jgi:iron complex outermembrane recepter protein
MAAPRNRFVLCLVWFVFSQPASSAESSLTLSAEISPQPLAEALAAFGRQTGLQLIYVSSVAETRHSKGARAGLAASPALAALLDGTGLGFEFLNARTVRIFPAAAAAPAAAAVVPAPRRYAERAAVLEEVVVTATRREEPLSKVPIAMAVWTQEAMEASGVKGMAQIGALTPGVDFGFRAALGGDLYTDLTIRGVANRHGSATAIYLDDTPIPQARVDRVEILRGPQGMLLGDHAQGGAVRFIMNQPSLTASSGLARAEWSTTVHGGMSYEMGAAAGGPIVDDAVGFRVSAWYRADGGYVDRVDPFTLATVDANANRYVSETVRGALILAPTDAVRIAPSLTYQSTNVRDTSTFYTTLSDPSGGKLRNGSLLQQPFDQTFYLASLKMTAALHIGELSSVTSYFDLNATATLDGTVPSILPPDSSDAVAWYAALHEQMFSQEVRLTSADSRARLEWMAGMLYSHEHMHFPQRQVQSSDTEFPDAINTGKTQLSGFGQIALRLSEHLTATAGVRSGRSNYDYHTETPPTSSGAAADTWMAPRFVLSYQLNEHDLLYLSASKGYGSGGVYPGIIPFMPQLYPPDSLWGYEIGSKSDLWQGRVHLDLSAFHIRWNNGPLDLRLATGEQDPVPGTANSNGFDLAVQALPAEHLSAALAISYVDARYAQTLPPGDPQPWVRKGDAVGGSPWSVTAWIEQIYRLGSDVTARIRAEDAFHSRNPGPLYTDNPYTPFTGGRLPDPSRNVLNLRAELRWTRFEAAAFVNNALDAQPLLWRAPSASQDPGCFDPGTRPRIGQPDARAITGAPPSGWQLLKPTSRSRLSAMAPAAVAKTSSGV